MRGKKSFSGTTLILAIFAVTLFASGTRAAAQEEKLLHSFNINGKDGVNPASGVIFDAAGNLYGTTLSGGTHNQGMVFELSPLPGGGWRESVLHNFNSKDGSTPYGGLILDGGGNLYGTTAYGGSGHSGTVFELSPVVGGGWQHQILYSFQGQKDGAVPYASLVFDATGNLYGTTRDGGGGECTDGGFEVGCGTVFELTPAGGGAWTEKILHEFHADGTDGFVPSSNLIFDAAGNLYGTTSRGSAYDGPGTVLELSPAADGSWTEKLLYNFGNSPDGNSPSSGVIFDALGNLYGMTITGGPEDGGTVFELTPTPSGAWSESILQGFSDGIVGGQEGFFPQGGVIFDGAGNLYGSTTDGGVYGFGTAFKMTPAGDGSWTKTILHNFSYNPSGGDAGDPSGLVFDAAGNLYGTGFLGGAYRGGAVFEIKH
jgi:uncharacterized repeat protein (TIGR03803 family)